MAKSINSVCPTVPAPSSGTVGQGSMNGTTSGTTSGQGTLKALANKVLGRDTARDRYRDSLSHTMPQNDGAWDSHIASRDEFEERAALIEYGSGVPRKWAEAFATLDRATPPKNMHPQRWHQIINDGGLFLDQWSVQALALGWRAVDVFGLSKTGPSARFDGMGLVACLRGRPVVAISDRSARIATDHGYQTFHRTPMGESVAMWDLQSRKNTGL